MKIINRDEKLFIPCSDKGLHTKSRVLRTSGSWDTVRLSQGLEKFKMAIFMKITVVIVVNNCFTCLRHFSEQMVF